MYSYFSRERTQESQKTYHKISEIRKVTQIRRSEFVGKYYFIGQNNKLSKDRKVYYEHLHWYSLFDILLLSLFHKCHYLLRSTECLGSFLNFGTNKFRPLLRFFKNLADVFS